MHDYDENYVNEETTLSKVRGKLKEGPCPHCGGVMKFDGECFFCDSCNLVLDEELYYRIYTGLNKWTKEKDEELK